MNNKWSPLQFKDLAVGSTFTFEGTSTVCTKTGAKTYRAPFDTADQPADSWESVQEIRNDPRS